MFKFTSTDLSHGSLAFQGGTAMLWFVLLLVLLAAGLVLLYRTTDRYARPRDRAVSFGLRAGALLLLFIPLFEPVLVTPDVVRDENFVAVLVDASESMNVADGPDEATRHQELRRVLFQRGVSADLEEHFKVRYYTFGERAVREDSVEGRTSDAGGTNLAAALDRVLADFRGLPLSGVVLLTDGADNSTGNPREAAEAFRARDVPLHVVGIGRASAEGERELLQARVNRGVEVSTGAEIDVMVRSWRQEREPVAVSLYHDDQLVHATRQTLKGDGKVDYFTMYYEPEGPEPREYTLRLEAAADERNTQNNESELLITPRDDTLKVLFIEGSPRRDFKFIKRALEDDRAVHVASILRTGTGKFYRQGIRSSDELAGGFPADEEELFRYGVVMFGDVEANRFSIEQLEMIRQFVRRRGGGFVMLGGRATFAEGAYWNNPIADLLPVAVDPGRRTVLPPSFGDPELEQPPDEQGFRFAPTSQGLESPILRLAPDPAENLARWNSLPGLTSINYLGAVKPGATVLAEKPEDGYGASEPLLVAQRYGKGRSAALATASTWRWRMLVDAEDHRHERFWRQFVRWLGASAPGRVEIALDGDRYAPEDEITARVNVYDPGFGPDADATLSATLTDALGTATPVTFRPDLGVPGTFTATLLPVAAGVHALQVTAATSDGARLTEKFDFLVRPSRREYHDAVLDQSLLEDIASAAGGAYYTPDDAAAIPANLRARRTNTSVYSATYLWDMPFFFLLLVGLLTVEWAWRRRRNLP